MAEGLFEHVAGRVRHHVEHMTRQVMQSALNSVVRVTIPGTPQKARAGGKESPRKRDVQVLAKRIESNILGSGALPSAVPNKFGDPVRIETHEGGPNGMPLVVTRGGYKAPHALHSGAEVVEYLRANTEFKRKKGVARMRVKKKGAKSAFTTARAWKEAARILKRRAGNFVSGWQRAAEAVHSQAVSKTVQAGGQYDYRGSVSRATGTVLEAGNAGAPTGDLQRYQRDVLGPHLARQQRYYAGTFAKYMERALKGEFRGGMRK